MADGNYGNAADSMEVQAAVNSALKEQKKSKRKKRLIVLGVIAAIIIIIVAVSNRPKDYDFSNPEAKVTVDTILNDFSNDTANASEKYSDKVIAVTGKVSSISDTQVTLEAYDDELWLYYVYATMENAEDLKQFKVGATATVEGVCKKTTMFGNINMEQCVINSDFAIVPDYENATEVDIDDLIGAYKENQVSADEVYKNKTISVTGIVSTVSDNYIVIEPKNADVFDWDCDIAVYFEDNADITKASEDKPITVTGECYGDGMVYTVKMCRAIAE